MGHTDMPDKFWIAHNGISVHSGVAQNEVRLAISADDNAITTEATEYIRQDTHDTLTAQNDVMLAALKQIAHGRFDVPARQMRFIAMEAIRQAEPKAEKS